MSCAASIDSDVPPHGQRRQIDRAMFDELVAGDFRDSTREAFSEIITAGARRGHDPVVLDSTRILAHAALRAAKDQGDRS